jgi:hypothetical protein
VLRRLIKIRPPRPTRSQYQIRISSPGRTQRRRCQHRRQPRALPGWRSGKLPAAAARARHPWPEGSRSRQLPPAVRAATDILASGFCLLGHATIPSPWTPPASPVRLDRPSTCGQGCRRWRQAARINTQSGGTPTTARSGAAEHPPTFHPLHLMPSGTTHARVGRTILLWSEEPRGMGP